MTTDAKKHTSFGAGETPSRAALVAALLSVNDIIPVANATEANTVAAAIAATGQNLATNPVVVSRANARGLHSIEISFDGTVWRPASGLLEFADKTAADAWAVAHPSLLTTGDSCTAGGVEYRWSGTAWVKPYARGTEIIVGDANGYLTITHGLGKIPIAAGAEICDDTPTVGDQLKINGGMTQADATIFKVRVYRFGTPTAGAWNAFGSNGVKISWWAFS
ncbi:hypothetical protein JNB63_02175 [Microbacterium trichothecenolyticum]|uniref:hypothetical protein n=1 Tax=Microbacterium trichothecenolyticum TaxID=69370 RepID=UPI001C6DDD3A|nr:hypothetical protein [Microbacterium trichothecenolyticum]MBW9118893.1 hypothetical protein [Microbacterium trichothecenolyticum]